MTTASYRAGAFLDAARAIGAEAVVATDRPQALAPLNPAGNLALAFGDADAATRAIEAFAREHPLDAVIAADDEGVLLAARAAEALRLPHHSAAAVRTARSKLATREAFARAGLLTPRIARCAVSAGPEAIAARVKYPCVLKPLFLAASRGVIRADDPGALAVAFRRIAALLARPEVAAAGGALATEILIEDYIPGIEVAVEGLVTRGALRVLAIFDKPDPLDGPYFEETIYVTPSRLDRATQRAIEAAAARAVAAIGLGQGPVHAELRWNTAGAWPLEIAPRSIGGLCSRSLRFGDGVSLEALILSDALGVDVAALERERCASGVMMIPIPRAGVLRAVGGVDAARGVDLIDELRITVPPGQELVPLPEGDRYLGFIFARGELPEQVEAALREAHRHLTFDIDPRTPRAGARASGVEGSEA